MTDMPEPRHLGDGAYVSFDGHQLWLAANDHRNRVIALEPGVFEGLCVFADAINRAAGQRYFRVPKFDRDEMQAIVTDLARIGLEAPSEHMAAIGRLKARAKAAIGEAMALSDDVETGQCVASGSTPQEAVRAAWAAVPTALARKRAEFQVVQEARRTREADARALKAALMRGHRFEREMTEADVERAVALALQHLCGMAITPLWNEDLAAAPRDGSVVLFVSTAGEEKRATWWTGWRDPDDPDPWCWRELHGDNAGKPIEREWPAGWRSE